MPETIGHRSQGQNLEKVKGVSVMKYELVIVWECPEGTKAIYTYNTEDEAEQAEKGMKIALGNQIAWSCVRPKYN